MCYPTHPFLSPLHGNGKLHFFSLFRLPYFLGCFICSVSAGNISGKVYYNGSQEGQITVVATKSFTENAVLELDGLKDFVLVPSINDLSGSEITVQYWFRGSSFQSAVRNQQNGWIVAGWNNKHILSNDGGVSGVDAGEGTTDGSWHHHVFTWKQGSINGFASYLDGKLVEARDSTNTPLPATDSALYFGANQGVAEFTNGELDEIAVWSRALSASEIASTWYSKLEGNESDLIGYWDFDDFTADDRSLNQHHGTFQGDAWVVEAEIPGLGVSYFTETEDTGDYLFENLPDGIYQLSAFLDSNGNDAPDVMEPKGVFNSNPFDLKGEFTNGDVLLIEAPQIIAQPSGDRLSSGEHTEFSIVVTGSEPLSYQWFKNDTPLSDSVSISGTETSRLRLSNSSKADSGTYKCIVKNQAGEVVSEPASLRVIENGLSISGNISYQGVLKGPIVVSASQTSENNHALSLDGDGDYATSPLFDTSGDEITIQCWFKGEKAQSLVRHQKNTKDYIVVGWHGLHALSFDGELNGPSAGGLNLVDGNWHQLTMSWKRNSPGGLATFLDGSLIEKRDSSDFAVPFMDVDVFFGAWNGKSEFAKGYIDEIAIWDRALTPVEVILNWDQSLRGDEVGLLGFWDFNDGLGRDLSSNGNNVELYGDANIVEDKNDILDSAVFTTTLEKPGDFMIRNILPGKTFGISAFIDLNGNLEQDPDEPTATYSGNPFAVNSDTVDIDIDLGGNLERPIIQITKSELGVTLSWDSSSNLRLYGRESMIGGRWSLVDGVARSSITLPTDLKMRFFQLRE